MNPDSIAKKPIEIGVMSRWRGFMTYHNLDCPQLPLPHISPDTRLQLYWRGSNGTAHHVCARPIDVGEFEMIVDAEKAVRVGTAVVLNREPTHFLANRVVATVREHYRRKNLTGTPSEMPAVMVQYGKFGLGIFSFGASGVVPELSVAWNFQGRPVLAWEAMWWTFTMAAHHRGHAEVICA